MNRSPEQAYRELQKLARAQGRNTQQLFELYIHERFLARLVLRSLSLMSFNPSLPLIALLCEPIAVFQRWVSVS